MEHEPLRTEVLIAATITHIRTTGMTPEDAPRIYEFVNAMMREETKRIYTTDLDTLDALIIAMRAAYETEQKDDFRRLVSSFAQALMDDHALKPKNPHIIALLLRVAQLIRSEKEITFESLAQQMLSHFEATKMETIKSRAAL
jgi:hypothetical protein